MLIERIQRGCYLDSVALMRVSRRVEAMAGVRSAALMMGTPANRALLRDAGLLGADGESAGPNDLIVALRAEAELLGRQALELALLAIAEPVESGASGEFAKSGGLTPRARSLGGALAELAQANLALISVPGDYAAQEARRSLMRGLHVVLFSDNVPLEDELALKELASERGLLMMGPDCGTALIGGVPIAFANAVPRGEIGIVSASGTGLQEVSSLIARLGGGVSHGLGVGGRDLDERVGGIGALAALAALASDPATRQIVHISKPPAPRVAAKLLDALERCGKPAIACFLGSEQFATTPLELAPAPLAIEPTQLKLASTPVHIASTPVRIASTLSEAAELAMGQRLPALALGPLASRQGRVLGLYCGGSLCAEAEFIFRRAGLATGKGANEFVDLGDDQYTRGRPHPMLAPEIRNDQLRVALQEAKLAVILVDVVIGYGAHPDPAGVLAEGLAASRGLFERSGAAVIASVTGTEQDPQIWSRQLATLRAAGVMVAASNAQAAELAVQLIASPG